MWSSCVIATWTKMKQNFPGGTSRPFYLLQLLIWPKLQAFALEEKLIWSSCIVHEYRIGIVSNPELQKRTRGLFEGRKANYKFCKTNIVINKNSSHLIISLQQTLKNGIKLWALTDFLSWKYKDKNIKKKPGTYFYFWQTAIFARKFCAIRAINRTTGLKIHLKCLTFLLAYTKYVNKRCQELLSCLVTAAKNLYAKYQTEISTVEEQENN